MSLRCTHCNHHFVDIGLATCPACGRPIHLTLARMCAAWRKTRRLGGQYGVVAVIVLASAATFAWLLLELVNWIFSNR
jgi:hypothetical protein